MFTGFFYPVFDNEWGITITTATETDKWRGPSKGGGRRYTDVQDEEKLGNKVKNQYLRVYFYSINLVFIWFRIQF